MNYRRFGRTNLQMPVFSCGGMRFQQSWKDEDANRITPENQANLEACVQRALELGIHHIETARGYGTSEFQLGRILPFLPREKILVQTKVCPTADPKEFLDAFRLSLSNLRLDYVDLFAIHGINNDEHLNFTLRKGGCLDVARQLQRDGRCRFIGFSTHGTERIISAAVRTGEFDYVNLHWYFVNPLNWPSIEAAARLDMGVFIISPNDKGGMLQNRPARMTALCAPLTPMQFNDLYCLARPQVHTLSCGVARPSDFDEHIAALAYYERAAEVVAPIEARLRAEMQRVLGADWCAHWSDGLGEYHQMPHQVNVVEILRLWTFAKSLGLDEWARMRYNLLSGGASHWFPGEKADRMKDERALRAACAKNPFADRIPAILRQAHALYDGAPLKRLSQSD